MSEKNDKHHRTMSYNLGVVITRRIIIIKSNTMTTNSNIILVKLTLLVFFIMFLHSCNSQKYGNKSYKDFDNKTIQFDQKKYKIRKNFPPVQRYYSRSSLFRPKK